MSRSIGLPLSRVSLPERLAAPAVLVLAAVLLMVWRTPEIVTAGRFWAEEGVVYFRDALLGSWYDALLAPRVGYYSAWNKLAALAAAAVPLERAPLASVGAALAVQVMVLWIVATSDAFARPAARALAVAVVLLAVPSGEVWLNTINSQFHFALGAAVLLVTGPGTVAVPLRLGFLAVAGATGPVSVFLAPLYAWRALRQRTPLPLAEAALIGVCALIQAWLVVQGLSAGARTGAFSVAALASTLGIKLLAMPWLGQRPAEVLSQALLSGDAARQIPAVAALAGMAAVVAAVVVAHPVARWLTAAAAALAALSCAGALGADPWVLVLPLAGGRYAYAPNALLGLAVLTVALAPAAARWRRALAGLLLAAFLILGAVAFARLDPLFATGPDWRAEVAAWRADPARAGVTVWPGPPWQIVLPRDR